MRPSIIAKKAILSEAAVTGNEVLGMYATNNICLEDSTTGWFY